MADISQITLPSGSTYNIKDATARQSIENIISAGLEYVVVTELPTASAETMGKIYLVAHSHGTDDIYDEYLTIRTAQSGIPVTFTYSWEKIGNTDIDLSNYVTDVTLNKQTATAITALNSTSGYIGASASGGAVAWNSTDTKAAVTGYSSPTTDSVIGADATFSVTQPSVTLTENSSTATGRLQYVKSLSVTSSNKMVTTSLKGVAGTTTASKVTAGTSQTTADGTWTASNSNANLLANISVSGEVLTIGAATLDTQTTTQFTASDVTVATANANDTTVATGTVSSSGTGSAVVTAVTPTTRYMSASASGAGVAWDSKDSVTALTGLGSPSTANVVGTSATFTATQPTVELAAYPTTGNGRVPVTNVSVKTTATVLTDATSLTVTKS